jgi:metal-dependent HD superfamily phosphatase/phosphodiesterase
MIDIDADGNTKVAQIVEYITESATVPQYWDCTNVMAQDRLGYNDHGAKHVEIVTRHALKMLRILEDTETPGIVAEYGMTVEDAEVVVTLAGLLHDTGHIVHRENHSDHSLVIANDLIDMILDDTGLYSDREQVIIKSETLHAIKSHDRETTPLTVEAGVIRVADALDMEKGRASVPDDIHAISALSVERVTVTEQDDGPEPVRVHIELNNSAGIFQVDSRFREKVEGSGLEDLITVHAEVVEPPEKQLIDTYEF